MHLLNGLFYEQACGNIHFYDKEMKDIFKQKEKYIPKSFVHFQNMM